VDQGPGGLKPSPPVDRGTGLILYGSPWAERVVAGRPVR